MAGDQRPRGRPRAGASDQRIGDQVRARRLLVGMTQEKLGDALGVSFQQVQKYERGANRISATRISEIAAALGVPVTHFYEAEDDGAAGRADGAAPDPARAGQNLRLAQAFARIEDPLVRQRIVDLVDSLAGGR